MKLRDQTPPLLPEPQQKLFQDLRESGEHGVRALNKLVRIYEVTNDWQPAIDAYRELEKKDPDLGEEGRIAHYYCELAEQAVQERDFSEARELLMKAASDRNGTVRTRIALANLAQTTDRHKEAIKIFRQVMAAEPRLIIEIVPQLAASCRAMDDQEMLTKTLNQLRKDAPDVSKAIALAAIYDANIVNRTALDCLREYVLGDEVLGNLVDTDSLQQGSAEEQQQALAKVREGLGGLVSQAHRYQCTECGYVTSQLLWQCPGCRSWETVSPALKFSSDSLAS